jgi:hypothetical protein
MPSAQQSRKKEHFLCKLALIFVTQCEVRVRCDILLLLIVPSCSDCCIKPARTDLNRESAAEKEITCFILRLMIVEFFEELVICTGQQAAKQTASKWLKQDLQKHCQLFQPAHLAHLRIVL